MDTSPPVHPYYLINETLFTPIKRTRLCSPNQEVKSKI